MILGPDCQVDMQALNFREAITDDIDKYADSTMYAYVMNAMMRWSDVEYDDPVHIDIAGGSIDAVSYDFETIQNTFETDSSRSVITDANGKDVKTEVMRYGNQGVFFFTKDDAYYMILVCDQPNFERIKPEFEKFLDGIVVHEDYTAADTSALSTTTAADTTAAPADTTAPAAE
jgi:hypothetical protein